MSRIRTVIPTESLEQRAFIHYCRTSLDWRLKWTHSSVNQGRRKPTNYGRLIAEGMVKGIPDVFIPTPWNGKHGLYLEFKGKKGKQTPEQIEYQRMCEQVGYGYEVVRTVDQAIDATLAYFS